MGDIEQRWREVVAEAAENGWPDGDWSSSEAFYNEFAMERFRENIRARFSREEWEALYDLVRRNARRRYRRAWFDDEFKLFMFVARDGLANAVLYGL